MEFRPLKIKPPSPERTTRMHLFTALLPPGVLEYCIESPEKIALELKNFFILPYKKNHPSKQSPIDIKYAGVSPTSEPSGTALEMTNYAAVKFSKFSNTGEHYGSDDKLVTNGIFKNNGHTAVTENWDVFHDKINLMTF